MFIYKKELLVVPVVCDNVWEDVFSTFKCDPVNSKCSKYVYIHIMYISCPLLLYHQFHRVIFTKKEMCDSGTLVHKSNMKHI